MSRKDKKIKFLEIVKQLQEDKLNEGYLILIQNGIFCASIGKDAVIMGALDVKDLKNM